MLARRLLHRTRIVLPHSRLLNSLPKTVGCEQQNHRSENGHKQYRSFVATSLVGLFSAFAIHDYSKRKKCSNFSIPHLKFVTVNAAEKFDDSEKTRKGGSGDEGSGDEGSGDEDGKSRRDRFNFIADVVAETAPSLAYIEIKDSGVRDFFTGQPVTSSNGAGFVVAEDGLILTNAHVVINKPRASIQVRLHDGRTFVGNIEDVDVRSDLATVRINCKNLPVIRLGQSSQIRPGEWVIAMGSPLSLSNTITVGVVSNVARPPDELGIQGRDVPEYIQTDAAITFGNSGGPLINLDGEAIGINSMKVTPGISFAIPIDYAKEFLKKSEESKKYTAGKGKTSERRYIGITMLTLNPQVIEELKARGQIQVNLLHGIVIYRVVVGSPADNAGIRPGDIVTHINGHPIHGSRDVYKKLEGDGDLVMTVIRDKNRLPNVVLKPESSQD